MGCPRACGRMGRCKVWWGDAKWGAVLETEGTRLGVASSTVGTVLGVKGTRECLGESCLKSSKTEPTSNQMIQRLNLLPAPLPFTTTDISHDRIYNALQGFPRPAVGFLPHMQDISSHLSHNLFVSGRRVARSFPGTEVTLPSMDFFWNRERPVNYPGEGCK